MTTDKRPICWPEFNSAINSLIKTGIQIPLKALDFELYDKLQIDSSEWANNFRKSKDPTNNIANWIHLVNKMQEMRNLYGKTPEDMNEMFIVLNYLLEDPKRDIIDLYKRNLRDRFEEEELADMSERFQKIDYNSFEKINAIREAIAQNLENIIGGSFVEWIDKMDVKDFVVSRLNLSGMTFCLAGRMERPHIQLKDMIFSSGGDVRARISSRVDFLVQGNTATTNSNCKLAQEKGIAVITEDKLVEMITGEAQQQSEQVYLN